MEETIYVNGKPLNEKVDWIQRIAPFVTLFLFILISFGMLYIIMLLGWLKWIQ